MQQESRVMISHRSTSTYYGSISITKGRNKNKIKNTKDRSSLTCKDDVTIEGSQASFAKAGTNIRAKLVVLGHGIDHLVEDEGEIGLRQQFGLAPPTSFVVPLDRRFPHNLQGPKKGNVTRLCQPRGARRQRDTEEVHVLAQTGDHFGKVRRSVVDHQALFRRLFATIKVLLVNFVRPRLDNLERDISRTW